MLAGAASDGSGLRFSSEVDPCFSGELSDCFAGVGSEVSLFDAGVSGAAVSSNVPKAIAEAEPFEAMLTLVVATSAGSERVEEAPDFEISWMDGARLRFGESRREFEECATLETTFWATEMLSRATSVTGAALDAREIADQVPGYQLWNRKKGG